MIQKKMGNRKTLQVKLYHGYGHAQNLIIMGHVLRNGSVANGPYANGVLPNIVRLIRLFMVRPVGGVVVRLQRGGNEYHATTATDGFFKLEWQEAAGIPAGWHEVTVDCLTETKEVAGQGKGSLFVPHITQYGFISDIDDTVLVSHSATIFKRLSVLFTKNPHTRTAFPDVVAHYRHLASAQTTPEVPNPFYFVSSSEWNLYNDLLEFFAYNKLPQGVFLLNSIKRWYELVKTGKTKHEGKLLRIIRILEAFPAQQFVLLGDNSQKDPQIYESVVKKYGNRIFAIYIRNISRKKADATRQIMEQLATENVHTCFFSSSEEAIEHSRSIGLIAGE